MSFYVLLTIVSLFSASYAKTDPCEDPSVICVGTCSLCHVQNINQAISFMDSSSEFETILLTEDQSVESTVIIDSTRKSGKETKPILVTAHPDSEDDIHVSYVTIDDETTHMFRFEAEFWEFGSPFGKNGADGGTPRLVFDVDVEFAQNEEFDAVFLIQNTGRIIIQNVLFRLRKTLEPTHGESIHVSGIRIACDVDAECSNIEDIHIRNVTFSHFPNLGSESGVGGSYRGVKINIPSTPEPSTTTRPTLVMSGCSFDNFCRHAVRLSNHAPNWDVDWDEKLNHCRYCVFENNDFSACDEPIRMQALGENPSRIEVRGNLFNGVPEKGYESEDNDDNDFSVSIFGKDCSILIQDNTFIDEPSQSNAIYTRLDNCNVTVDRNSFLGFGWAAIFEIDHSHDSGSEFKGLPVHATFSNNFGTCARNSSEVWEDRGVCMGLVDIEEFEGTFNMFNNILSRANFSQPVLLYLNFWHGEVSLDGLFGPPYPLGGYVQNNLVSCRHAIMEKIDPEFERPIILVSLAKTIVNVTRLAPFSDFWYVVNNVVDECEFDSRNDYPFSQSRMIGVYRESSICDEEAWCEISNNVFANSPASSLHVLEEQQLHTATGKDIKLIEHNRLKPVDFSAAEERNNYNGALAWIPEDEIPGKRFEFSPEFDYRGTPRPTAEGEEITAGPFEFSPCGMHGELLANGKCKCKNHWKTSLVMGAGLICGVCPKNFDEASDCLKCAAGYKKFTLPGSQTCTLSDNQAIAIFSSIGGVAILIVVIIACLLFAVSSVLLVKKLKKKKKSGCAGEDGMDQTEKVLLREQRESISKLKIDSDNFTIDYDSLEIEKSIGKGGSNSVVFLCKFGGKKCAFKCFKLHDFGTEDIFEEFEKEVSLLASLSHPFILKFYGATLKPPRVGYVMEFCQNGNVREYLSKENLEIPTSKRIEFLVQISSAMTYIHERKIIHRDIKSDNILISDEIEAKLCDFGLSRSIKNPSSQLTTRIGTGHYMPPEIVIGESYSEKCDVFSFGITAFEILTGNFNPYDVSENSDFNIERRVSVNPDYRPSLKTGEVWNDRKELASLVKSCWIHDSEDRPSFAEISEEFSTNVKRE